ncbi:MAG TPA: alpha/beta hydrolase [Thermoanaerobaculia bacterium]|nr:alpha/beta hydrolase [Thermoanaerobaculia bacterium]
MTKQTVLMIHSGGASSRQWRTLATELAPRFHVLVPDLLGYGESGPWPQGEPFHFRQDVAFLESLLTDGEPVHLVGHSYGGFLALKLALQRPELVRSIAVYEPVAFGVLDPGELDEVRNTVSTVEWRPGPDGSDEAWLRSFIDWWNGAGAWDRLPEETRKGFRAVGWKVFQEVMTLGADTTDAATYGTIAVPTLLLGGERTPLTERRVVERLGVALPRATVRLFPGVGHMGPITHTPLVNGAIAAHLQEWGG